jgi:hypothetical protein
MIRKLHKVGRVELVAGGPKQIDIPANLGTITGVYFMPKNGSATPANGKTVASIATIALTAHPKNGTSFDIIKATTPAKLKIRELYYGSVFGVENSEAIVGFDPSAALFVAESTRAYMNLGGADMQKYTAEIVSKAALDGVDAVEVFIEYDRQVSNLGAHVRLGKVTQKVPAAGGDIEITHLPKNSNGSFQYQKIDIQIPDDFTADKITLEVDNGKEELRELNPTLLNRLLTEAGRTPQSGLVTLDFSKEAFANYNLPGKMEAFKIVLTLTAGVGAVESQIDIDYELLYT